MLYECDYCHQAKDEDEMVVTDKVNLCRHCQQVIEWRKDNSVEDLVYLGREIITDDDEWNAIKEEPYG
jgi:hypothetical protein